MGVTKHSTGRDAKTVANTDTGASQRGDRLPHEVRTQQDVNGIPRRIWARSAKKRAKRLHRLKAGLKRPRANPKRSGVLLVGRQKAGGYVNPSIRAIRFIHGRAVRSRGHSDAPKVVFRFAGPRGRRRKVKP